MAKSLRAIYENGVLRPLERVDLDDQQQVTVVIEELSEDDDAWMDTDFHAWSASEADEGVTLEAVRAVLAKIPGSMTPDFVAERDER